MKNISLLLILTIFCADLQAMRTIEELIVEGNRVLRELNNKFKPSLVEKIRLINAENSHKIYLTEDERLRLDIDLCEVFKLVCTDSEVLDMKAFLTLSDYTILTTKCHNDKSIFENYDYSVRHRQGVSCSVPFSQYESVDLSQYELDGICAFSQFYRSSRSDIIFYDRSVDIHRGCCIYYPLSYQRYLNIFRLAQNPHEYTILQTDPTYILTRAIIQIARSKLRQRIILRKIIPNLSEHFPSVLALLITDYMMIDLKKIDIQKLLLWLSFKNKINELPRWQEQYIPKSCCTIL